MIAELEARGAKVMTLYSGGLDFSGPVEEYFVDRTGKARVNTIINLTGESSYSSHAPPIPPKELYVVYFYR